MTPEELVLSRLSGVRETASGWTAKCPAHDDQKPSLSIMIGDNGNVVPHCFAGCEYKEIVDALGLQQSDLYPKGGETVFRSDSHPNELHSRDALLNPKRSTVSGKQLDWQKEVDRFREALPSEKLHALAGELGVTSEALQQLEIGWATAQDLRRMRAGGAEWTAHYPIGAFTFPERNGAGRIVGIALRAIDGRKGSPSSLVGARRGLVLSLTDADDTQPVLLVEGATDVAACATMGLPAVGRPSCFGGVEQIAEVLEGRTVLVVGERDQKSSGDWPGRDGARKTAKRLAQQWDVEVSWAIPPSKDIRAWLQDRIAGGLELDDDAARVAAGQDLVQQLLNQTKSAEPAAREKQGDVLVRLALSRYRLGLDQTGEPFAVENDRRGIVMLLRGSSDKLRAVLARDYRRETGSIANSSAINDALRVLHGEALECTPETVHLRVAEHESAIVIDLGRADGKVVRVCPGGRELLESSPVLFRRTALTGELTLPQRGGELASLRELINISDASWPLALGWLIAGLLPRIPHPVLLLGGLHGSGKTTAAKLFVNLIDPSPAPLRSPPTEPKQWSITAAGSWAFVVDNVSAIPQWWSDALCKVVTGDGWVARKLYTDGDLAVQSFRRVVAMTSIDPGALRGDLGDRLLILELSEITESHRKDESSLMRQYDQKLPGIFGALLDLLAEVLERLPTIKLSTMPRMADFARVQAAVDAVTGLTGLDQYLGQRDRIAIDVVEGDLVGTAILRFMEGKADWEGSPTELYTSITPEKPPRKWPKTASGLSGSLKRLAPSLRACGVDVEHGRDSTLRRGRFIRLQQARSNGESGTTNQPCEDDEIDESLAVRSGHTSAALDALDALDGDSDNKSARERFHV